MLMGPMVGLGCSVRAWRLLDYLANSKELIGLLRAGVEASVCVPLTPGLLLAAPCGRGGFQSHPVNPVSPGGCSVRAWRLR